MNCTKCGMPLTAEDQFCKNCGTPVVKNSAPNVGVNNVQTPGNVERPNLQSNVNNGVSGVRMNVNPVNTGMQAPNNPDSVKPDAPMNLGMDMPKPPRIEPGPNNGPAGINPEPVSQVNPGMGGANMPNPTPSNMGRSINPEPVSQANAGMGGVNMPNPIPSNMGESINPAPKGNNSKMVIIIAAVVVIAVIAAAVLFVLKNNNENNTTNENNNVAVASTYKVKQGGFTFKIPTDLIYQVEDNAIAVGNENDTWVAYIEVINGSYNQILKNKNAVLDNLKKGGYTSKAPAEKNIEGVSYLVYEAGISGTNAILAYTKANSSFVFGITAYSVNNDFDYDILKEVSTIVKTAEYTGETNNLSTFKKMEVQGITDLAK